MVHCLFNTECGIRHIIGIKVVQDIPGKTAKKSMGTTIGPGHGNSSTFCPLPPVISRQKVFQ